MVFVEMDDHQEEDMSRFWMRGIKFSGLVLAAGLAWAGTAVAQERSQNQIIDALKPKPRLTRSLTATPPVDAAKKADEAKFVDTLRRRQTRSLTMDERDKIATISKEKPSIDLEINFEFNSDRISSVAISQVTALGQALSSADLKGSTFVVAGHTDAKGGDALNQSLSERRADAVKRFLVEKYKIEDTNLVTVGYGKAQLKNQANPLSGENRRVQVVNMAN
jgi:outer membrane protein OmpA-like peptidoglycan-associated protein